MLNTKEYLVVGSIGTFFTLANLNTLFGTCAGLMTCVILAPKFWKVITRDKTT